jgi:hypothetical protein
MLGGRDGGTNRDLTNRRAGLLNGHRAATSEARVVRQRPVTVRQKERAAGGTAA